MGATNTTTYYNLSQFIGTDKPAWLQDYNGDMLKIDTAINNAKTAADSAANAASAAQNDATTALGDITTINGNISTINTTLGTAVGNINTINSLIGNGTPTTTDQTIIGAINEINADVVPMKAHLNGNAVLGVITQAKAISGITGANTLQELCTALLADINATVSALENGEYLELMSLAFTGGNSIIVDVMFHSLTDNNGTITSFLGDTIAVGLSGMDITGASIQASDSVIAGTHVATDGTTSYTALNASDLLSTWNLSGATYY